MNCIIKHFIRNKMGYDALKIFIYIIIVLYWQIHVKCQMKGEGTTPSGIFFAFLNIFSRLFIVYLCVCVYNIHETISALWKNIKIPNKIIQRKFFIHFVLFNIVKKNI